MTAVLPNRVVPEWGKCVGPPLTKRDLALVESLGPTRIRVEVSADGLVLRACSWVGVIRFESFELRIVPKLAGGNLGLVRLLEWTCGIDAIDRGPERTDSLELEDTSLLEWIGLLLVEECERIVRRGLVGDYVEREEELAAVRGRILADRQVLERMGRCDRVWCRFDEHELDVTENRLLNAGLVAASRWCRSQETLRRIRAMRSTLDGICSAEAPASIERIEYHRLNAHYRWAHVLARLLLENAGIADLFAGAERSCVFLLDMNRLFERFVTKLVAYVLRGGRNWRVHPQAADATLIRELGTDRNYGSIRPDLLLSSSGGVRRYPIDAKYKLYSERSVDSGDVYQSFLYAYAYGRTEHRRGMLVHPSSNDQSAASGFVVRVPGSSATISTIGLPIARALDELRSGREGPVLQEFRHRLREECGDP